MRPRGLERPNTASLPTNLELLLSEAVVSDPQVAEAEMADEVVSA